MRRSLARARPQAAEGGRDGHSRGGRNADPQRDLRERGDGNLKKVKAKKRGGSKLNTVGCIQTKGKSRGVRVFGLVGVSKKKYAVENILCRIYY